MRIRKILGGFAWVLLAAMLVLVNAAAGSADEIFAQPVQSGASAAAK